MTRLTVLRVDGAKITCKGTFATADKKGIHSGLNPVLLLSEIDIAPDTIIQPGEVIEKPDSGRAVHQARAK